MPQAFDGEDFETEMIILPKIKDLHKSLLEEDIREQIRNPFESKVDCVETFNQQVEETKNDEDVEEDDLKKIDEEAISFYLGVIREIDSAFHLECDMEGIAEKNIDDIRDICEAMYGFFVMKRKKNIKNMMLNYIIENIDTISKSLEYLKKKKDVTSQNTKNLVDDSSFSLIIANLQEVLRYIKNEDNDMLYMIEYLDLAKFNNFKIKELMMASTIISGFQELYFAPLFSYQDSNYDDIIAKIEHGIFKAAKKKK